MLVVRLRLKKAGCRARRLTMRLREVSAHCGPSVGVKDAALQPVDPDIDPSAARHDACVSKLLSKPEYGMICLTDGAELLPPCSKCGGKLVPVRSHPSRR